MTDDALLPFIRAYRDENPAASLDTRAIRRRVLLGYQLRQRRRLFAVRFLLPIAATFFGSVALAASQGALPRWQEVRDWLAAEPSAPAPKPPEARRQVRGVRRAHPPPAQKNVEPPLPEPPVSEPPVIELPAIEPPPSRPSAPEAHGSRGVAPPASAASAAPTESLRSDVLKADLAAYERAHRLHFHGGDPSAALAAWDTYLASHGAGTFVPEARFNRAICLLRLGRRADAKIVLTSIAESGTAVYGRDRARALLDAME